MKKSLFLSISFIGLILGMIMLPMTALADTISPASYSDTLLVGESVTITKTVTIDDAPPTDATLDVMFLFDTTGSMGGLINDAKASASDILSGLSGYGDVAFGVSHYEDFPEYPYGSPYVPADTPYELLAEMGSAAAAQSAITDLELGSGADTPESQLTALTALTEISDGTEEGWREDATKIVVWFGDAPGHEGDETGYPGTATTASTIDALEAAGITVVAVDLNRLDSTGQATAITGATGGAVYDYTAGTAGALVDLIRDAVEDVYAEYEEVALDISEAPAGVTVAYTPTTYTGEYDRSEERSFDFDVTFTGVAEGDYDFEIYALVDGGRVATESDSITVGVVPEPNTMLLMGIGLMGVAGVCRRRKK